MVDYARPGLLSTRRRPPILRAVLSALGVLWWGIITISFLVCVGMGCGFGSPFFSVIAGVFCTVLLPILAAASIAIRKRRAMSVVAYVEQATRLDLPLEMMLDAAKQNEKGRLRREISRLVELLRQGVPLASALHWAVPGISSRAVKLIESAERAGDLPRTLNRLVTEHRRTAPTPGSVSYWWIYPIVLIAVMSFVVSIMSFLIMPKYERLFRDFGMALPWVTVTMITISRNLAFPFAIISILFLAGFSTVSMRRTFRGAARNPSDSESVWTRWGEWFESILPGAHFFRRDRAMADACDVIGDALTAGYPLERAVDEARVAVSTISLRKKMTMWLDGLTSGRSPADAARAATLPMLFVGTIATAQASGRLDDGLRFLARYYSTRFSRTLTLFRGAVVPAGALIMGAAVLFVVLGLLMPIVKLIEAASTAFNGSVL